MLNEFQFNTLRQRLLDNLAPMAEALVEIDLELDEIAPRLEDFMWALNDDARGMLHMLLNVIINGPEDGDTDLPHYDTATNIRNKFILAPTLANPAHGNILNNILSLDSKNDITRTDVILAIRMIINQEVRPLINTGHLNRVNHQAYVEHHNAFIKFLEEILAINNNVHIIRDDFETFARLNVNLGDTISPVPAIQENRSIDGLTPSQIQMLIDATRMSHAELKALDIEALQGLASSFPPEGTITILADGNCMINAALATARAINADQEHTTTTLRAAIADHIQNNIEDFRQNIVEHILEMVLAANFAGVTGEEFTNTLRQLVGVRGRMLHIGEPLTEADIREYILRDNGAIIDQYIAMIRTDRAWLGAPELAAIAILLNLRIEVLNNNGGPFILGDAEQTIQLWHANNHYDAILQPGNTHHESELPANNVPIVNEQEEAEEVQAAIVQAYIDDELYAQEVAANLEIEDSRVARLAPRVDEPWARDLAAVPGVAAARGEALYAHELQEAEHGLMRTGNAVLLTVAGSGGAPAPAIAPINERHIPQVDNQHQLPMQAGLVDNNQPAAAPHHNNFNTILVVGVALAGIVSAGIGLYYSYGSDSAE